MKIFLDIVALFFLGLAAFRGIQIIKLLRERKRRNGNITDKSDS